MLISTYLKIHQGLHHTVSIFQQKYKLYTRIYNNNCNYNYYKNIKKRIKEYVGISKWKKHTLTFATKLNTTYM